MFVTSTLVPTTETRTAVVFCVGGAAACWFAGSILARFDFGVRVAVAVERWARDLCALGLGLRPVTFQALLMSLAFAFGCFAALFVFDGAPGVIDSALYLYQARMFAAGLLAAPSPEHYEFFEINFMLNDGAGWYTQYPPGYPALLVPAVWLGVPWILNPLFNAVTCVAVYHTGRLLYGEGVARVASAMMVLSPFAVLMAGDTMSHSSALLMTSILLWMVVRGGRGNAPVCYFIAGLAGGAAFAVRPYTAVSVCMPAALFAAWDVLRGRRWGSMVLAVLGAALPLAGVAYVNASTNGSPFVFTYSKLHGPAHHPGFGASVQGLHDLGRAIRQTLSNLNAFNKDVFQAPFPVLALTAAGLVLGGISRWSVMLALSFLSLTGAYFFYFYQDLYLGPRFLFEALGACLLLAACGVREVVRRIGSPSFPPRRRNAVTIAAALIALVGLVLGVGPRVWKVKQGYSNVSVVQAVDQLGLQQALVFVSRDLGAAYLAAFARNDPRLDRGVVFAADLGERNTVLRAAYPGWPHFRWDGTKLVAL